jgi:hypothetical protein
MDREMSQAVALHLLHRDPSDEQRRRNVSAREPACLPAI